MFVSAIIAAGGTGRRLGAAVPKQILDLGGGTMLERSATAFLEHPAVSEVVFVLPLELMSFAVPMSLPVGRLPPEVKMASAGARRQDSVANAFDQVSPAADVVLIHDAARPFVSAGLISRTIDAAAVHGAAIAAVQSRDTVKRVTGEVITETIPRETIYLAQTPQGFRRDVLAAAVKLGRDGAEATDEAGLAERAGYQVHVVEGDPGNVKITTEGDLAAARERMASQSAASMMRVGTGYDLHRLVEGRPLILGGVTIASDRGALGHSDADVACHAATDAILGGAGLGDIGRHFPDTDPRWKGADSIALLAEAARLVREAGFDITNLDVTIVLERPKIKDAVTPMRARLAGALGIDVACVSVKGKTNEGVDAVGRGEAIAAHAVALLRSSR